MRKLLIIVLALGSFSLLASDGACVDNRYNSLSELESLSMDVMSIHPEETDLLVNVGLGSKLYLKKDLNLKPNSKAIIIKPDNSFAHNCGIVFEDVDERDRVIRKDSSFLISETKSVKKLSYKSGIVQYLMFDKGSGLKLVWCSLNNLGEPMNIGEFRRFVNSYFELEIAEPIEIGNR